MRMKLSLPCSARSANTPCSNENNRKISCNRREMTVPPNFNTCISVVQKYRKREWDRLSYTSAKGSFAEYRMSNSTSEDHHALKPQVSTLQRKEHKAYATVSLLVFPCSTNPK